MLAWLACAVFALGQGSQLPKYTVATLPSAISQPHYIVQVIDGASSTDCTTGQGAWNVVCVNVAGVWYSLGSVNPTFTGLLSGTSASFSGAVAATNMAVSVEDPAYGAIGDNSTDNTTAFAAMEASTIPEFYMPAGTYKTTQAYLTKRYWGPGSVRLGVLPAKAGTPSAVQGNYDNDLSGPNSLINTTNEQTVIWIGDSITYGQNSDHYTTSYPALVQSWFNAKMGTGQGSYLSGGNMDTITPSGTVTHGTAGPFSYSYILAPGASLTIPATDARYAGLWFTRTPTSGNIVVSSAAGTWGTFNTSGTAATDQVLAAAIPTGSSYAAAQSITFTCSGASVEVTGLWAYPAIIAQNTPLVFMNQAKSGLSTASFNNATIVASIKAQNLTLGYFTSYVLALGTNDIYSSGAAVSSAQFKANLLSIISLFGPTYRPILTVPLRPNESIYSPVLEPFDNYRNVVYQIARQLSLPVVDLSELDLNSIGAYGSDGLHPNVYGYQIMADFWYRKLGLANVPEQPYNAGLTLNPGVSAAGTPYASPGLSMRRGVVFLSGTLALASPIVKGSIIAYLPGPSAFYTAPNARRMFIVPTVSVPTGEPTGEATLLINPEGSLVLYDYTSGTLPGNLALDGVSYVVSQ
jgi:lysophospholipase L1-like esterase